MSYIDTPLGPGFFIFFRPVLKSTGESGGRGRPGRIIPWRDEPLIIREIPKKIKQAKEKKQRLEKEILLQQEKQERIKDLIKEAKAKELRKRYLLLIVRLERIQAYIDYLTRLRDDEEALLLILMV